ncbi:FtsQ-type POTRA domain-containing protein [bacterium]|nr:FtsQ-type POTRA domain-containing protein [bacterium]
MKKMLKHILRLAIPAIIIVGGAFVALHEDFYIKTINIAGNNRIPRQSVIELLPFDEGEHILTIPKKKTENMLEADPKVAWAEIRRRWGGKVDVILCEEYPILLFAADKIWGLTDKGLIIPFDEPFQIPNLVVLTCENFEKPVAQYRILEENKVKTGLAFYEKIKKTAPYFLDKLSEIHVSEAMEITAILRGDGIAVEFGRTDPELRFQRLSAILNDMGTNRASVSKIDLRYSDQAVVKIEKGSKEKVWGSLCKKSMSG